MFASGAGADSDAAKNPFAGMDSATTAPDTFDVVSEDNDSDEVSVTSSEYSARPSVTNPKSSSAVGSASENSEARRVVIHPASLRMTSALLAVVVSLLGSADGPAAAGGNAGDGGAYGGRPSSSSSSSSLSSSSTGSDLLVRAKYMYDMTRVLLAELPADAALDRL